VTGVLQSKSPNAVFRLGQQYNTIHLNSTPYLTKHTFPNLRSPSGLHHIRTFVQDAIISAYVMSGASSPRTRPAPLACAECRRRHVKCDGSSPICGRCVQERLSCTYTASRRGRARRSKRNAGLTNSSATESENNNSDIYNVNNLHTFEENRASTTTDLPPLGNNLQPLDSYHLSSLQSLTAPTPYVWSLNTVDRERLFALFYNNFYAAHPFLVPKLFYSAQRYPYYLDLMVCFVGHHFTSPLADAAAFQDAVRSAMSAIDEQTPCRVQALVLYAIVLHSLQQPKEAISCITRAASLALQLGMNEPLFASTNSAGSPVVEESLRRTWWELYTVDTYVSAVHRSPTFTTAHADPLPLLPCAQSVYEEGQCDPNPPTLRAFENRVFSTDSRTNFSPMCFRIDAIRIVGRVSKLAATGETNPDGVQAIDNAIASWEYNLPPSFKDVVSPSGEIDLILFQARCFISCASIFLHFPRSELPPKIPSAQDIACAKNHASLASTSRYHTVRAVAASKALSTLITIPWPLDQHSPFVVCGLVLSCVVQLAAASIHFHDCMQDCLSQHRDMVVLMLGALGRLGENWTLAQNAVRKLRVVAETVFVVSEERSAPSSVNNSVHDSAVDVADGVNDVFWFDLFSPENLGGDLFSV